jgi:hypothetical protein
MGRNSESGDRIATEIRRMWRRSTAKNMPPLPRHESPTRGIGYEEVLSCAGRSPRGETPKNRKIVEGENDLTRFNHAFRHDADI